VQNHLECRLDPRSGGAPKSLLVLLHGRGANGEDLLPLAHNFADLMPTTVFHLPNAPIALNGLPLMPQTFEWFNLTGSGAPGNELLNAQHILNDYLDRLLSGYALDGSRCVLLGFSQGTMIALHAGLLRLTQLGGIIGFSGAFISTENLRLGLFTKPPVALIHGDMDPIVPFHASENAAGFLAELDIPTELHVLPGLGHSIDHRGIKIAIQFMHQILGAD
jgi:phospholipase/carboxylesterase